MKFHSPKIRTIAVSIIVAAGSAAVVASYAWREEQKAATFSCASSVAAALSYAPSNLGHVSSEWRQLSNVEIADLLGKGSSFDCAGSTRPFADTWNHSLHAAVRQNKHGEFEFRVWSVGPDGATGTSDDIVMPYGETVPSELFK